VSELEEKPQQQILFEEIKIEQTDKENFELAEQVIIENELITELDVDNEPIPDIVEQTKPKWLWRVATALLMILVLIETVEFFILGFSQEPIIASLYGALLFILSLIAGRSLYREFQGLRQYKQRESLQQQAERMLDGSNDVTADQLCQQMVKQLPCDLLSKQEKQWHETIEHELSDKELLQLFSRNVLTSVDQKALDKVSKYSTEAVVLVALSPLALVDMLIMLWRNLKMLDEIAHLYGLRLGYWSRIKLIKQVFVNMVYAGATELIADVGADLIGADLLGKLSARLAQGLGAGMLTARLGLKAISLCRPIPFKEDAPKLKDVRKKLISQIKGLANNSVPNG